MGEARKYVWSLIGKLLGRQRWRRGNIKMNPKEVIWELDKCFSIMYNGKYYCNQHSTFRFYYQRLF
jgi:hypothetical protein